mmetsp:Transcript_10314/g.15609  ORF Transcript_10314/g.15609 Transcript_10314/m.15609 type:complete len:106 (-) Transcript_10314:399-716(-)
MNGFITFMFNLKSLLQCLHLLHGLHTKDNDNATDQNTVFGSAIRHAALFSKQEKKSDNDDCYTQLKEKCIREIEGGTKSLETFRVQLVTILAKNEISHKFSSKMW